MRFPGSDDFAATINKHRFTILSILGLFVLAAVVEIIFGRPWWGPDGLADAYSLSHVLHGIIFYWLVWLVMRNAPVGKRLIWALMIEVAWELIENTPMLIERYQQATMATGYTGDSIINSLSDIAMAIIGFFIAYKSRIWISIAVIVAVELLMLWWVRDNLTLNILMLLYPIEAIKLWQMAI